MIGNDIVDLGLAGVLGKSGDRRFLERVFTVRERDDIRLAADPDEELWALWAAKEAAFKAVSRAESTVVFSPKRFEVAADRSSNSSGELEGLVRHCGAPDCQVRWIRTPGFVHCVGVLEGGRSRALDVKTAVAPGKQLLSDVSPEGGLSAAELTSVRTSQSTAVRLLARKLCSENGLPKVEIIRSSAVNGWGAPVAFSASRPVGNAEISLSHDGRWVAAALLLR